MEEIGLDSQMVPVMNVVALMEGVRQAMAEFSEPVVEAAAVWLYPASLPDNKMDS